jgi:hypothetical protein
MKPSAATTAAKALISKSSLAIPTPTRTAFIVRVPV